jgi:hypothetical protein
MNPPPLPVTDDRPPISPAAPELRWWVRGTLLFFALGWTGIFVIAAWLRPYAEDGTPLRMETHRQMGLPACTFKYYSGLPCPSCGMTTSFALLVRGDVVNSLKANAVGTGLAVFGMLFVPWALACVVAKRYFFIESAELVLLKLVMALVALMLLRWVIVLALIWLNGSS